MEFLKKFFNDDNIVVGLCKFNKENKRKTKNYIEKEMFFNPFQSTKEFVFNYETNYSKNIMLL